MHPVLEQIKQFLAPRWYKLQKSVVEFVKQFLVPKLRELQKYMVKFAKQFLVPKWHKLQKYMLDFKERMTMKRMVVMCLLLVAVVCGILALARGDGKQDWEKEPYPFEVEIVGIFSNGFRYSTNSPVRVWDNWGNSYDIKNMDVEVDFDKDNRDEAQLFLTLFIPRIILEYNPSDLKDIDGDLVKGELVDTSITVIEFANGQKVISSSDIEGDSSYLENPSYAEWNLDELFSITDRGYYDTEYSYIFTDNLSEDEQLKVNTLSLLRSYDIVSVTDIWWADEDHFADVLKIEFKDFHSAATINAIFTDLEKRAKLSGTLGKLLTEGSSSSKLSSVQSNKSVSTNPDDDEEEIDSVLVEKGIVIKSVETQHNVVQNGQKGMNIIVNYSVEGMKGKTGDLNAYFYFEDGTPLKDGNKSSVPCYGTYDGSVVVGKQFTPRYDDVAMSSTLFMPYDELHLRKGKFSLKFYCAIFDDEMKQQATSNWKYFTVTQQ